MLISKIGAVFEDNVDLIVEQNNETLAITRDFLNEYFGLDFIAKYSSMIEKSEEELLVFQKVDMAYNSTKMVLLNIKDHANKL